MVETTTSEEGPPPVPEGMEQNCIFCHIITGSVPSKEVYQDDKVKAVLDINPANPGHVLILPKKHFMIMPQLSDDLIGHIFMVAKHISKACIRVLKAQGTNVFVANGAAAGQRAQHFMAHVVPRKEGDGVQAFHLPHRQLPDAQYIKMAELLKERMGKALGREEVAVRQVPAGPEATQKEPKSPVFPRQPVVGMAQPDTTPRAMSAKLGPEIHTALDSEIPKPERKPKPMPEGKPKTVDLDGIADLLSGKTVPQTSTAQRPPTSLEGGFVASKKGEKYHLKNCPFISKINPQNRIEIADKAEARARELKPCECVANAE